MLFLTIVAVLLLPALSAAIWPIPRALSTGNSTVKLHSNFQIDVSVPKAPSDLYAAVSRTSSRLKTDKFERLVVGRGATDASSVAHAAELTSLVLSITKGSAVRSIAQETTRALHEKSESYALSIPQHGGRASLTANSTLGLLRGLATFEQIFYDYQGTKYTLSAPIEIDDTPAFPHRGFSLDTSRNFYPVSDIQRTLDAMSFVKLGTLYWHVIDSQSFPLEVEGFPLLSEKGAYDSSSVYTLDDVQSIISYANERGVDVVMELDSPGHTTGISFGYPEHVACANKSPWQNYASEPPAGQLRIASDSTLAFIKAVFESIVARLPGTMVSSGGDEVNLPCWAEDEETAEDLRRKNISIAQALDTFIGEVQGVFKRYGKQPFIKSDMILAHNVTVTNDTIAVVWQKAADAPAMAARGISFIHQPSDYFYLDCGGGEWIGDDVDGNSWCDPFKTWQRAYSFDPYANLTSAQRPLVLGGQMPLWSEQSSPENLDSIVWPRLASGAEVFWTGERLPDGTPRIAPNVTGGLHAFGRINELRFRLVDRGVSAIALQPLWCVLRAGLCDLWA